jgi:hypothetical protein
MKRIFKTSLLGAAALFTAHAAHATTIDFENANVANAPFAPLLSDGDYVTQGAYYVQALDPNNNSGAPDMALVASLVNGADPSTCLDGVCPSGNATNYLASVDDGVLQFGRLDGGQVTLGSFDAAFLAPSGMAQNSGTAAYLAIESDRTDGSYAVGIFSLGGPNANGVTAFQTFQAGAAQIIGGTGTLTSGPVATMYAYAYYCDPASGQCSAFTSNKGQFALDNLALQDVSAVPEPSQWLLMTLGLGAMGAAIRRRRAA